MKISFKAFTLIATLLGGSLILFSSCNKDDDNYQPTPLPGANAIVASAAGDSLAIVGKLN